MHTRPRMSAYIRAMHTRRAVKTLLATQIIQCAKKNSAAATADDLGLLGVASNFFPAAAHTVFSWLRLLWIRRLVRSGSYLARQNYSPDATI